MLHSHTHTHTHNTVQGLKDASYKPLTGEEDEICVLQLRTKLYRLTEINKPTQGKAEAGSGGGGGGVASAPVQRDWVEAGVGQAKILVPQAREMDTTSAPARLVMRREPGTTVLINALLKDPVGVAKHAEKALRLTCLDEKGQPSTFLFRFKLMDEMEQMLQEVHTQLEIAGSGGGDVTDKQKKENEGENAV